MAKPNARRRWLQFRLRTLMLFTFALALWLGVEVHKARLLQRHLAALRELGGQVEAESSRWSLLGWIDPEQFGLRVVSAEVPGGAVPEAIPHLEALPGLRTVKVVFDGTCDIASSWKDLHRSLPAVAIIPFPEPEKPRFGYQVHDWGYETATAHCARRFLRKAQESPGGEPSEVGALVSFTDGLGANFQYQVVGLRDGSVAELVFADSGGVSPDRWAAVLLVNDSFAGAKTLPEWSFPRFEDVNGDGYPDVAFQIRLNKPLWDASIRGQCLPGDSRFWASAYSIEADGFRPLLPGASLPDVSRHGE